VKFWQIADGDNLRPVDVDRAVVALAALEFMEWLDNGTAVIRERGTGIRVRGLETLSERL
jgi:hypothetical protein